jgi:hypothetical protein
MQIACVSVARRAGQMIGGARPHAPALRQPQDHVALALAKTRRLFQKVPSLTLSAKSDLASATFGFDVVRLPGVGLKGQRLVAKVLADLRRRLDPFARTQSAASERPAAS